MNQIISYKKIGQLAFPIIVSQSVVLLNGLIDLAFIGPFGTEAIAAVAIANALCATLFNFLEGFRIGTTVLIAKAAAARDIAKGRAIINSGLCLVLAIGITIIVFASDISNLVYHIAGNAQIKYYGVDYLTIWLWAVPVILFSYVLTGLFRGVRDTATPLYSTVAVCILNAGFSYLFVYGGLGIGSMGVKGAAWGTLAANLIGLFITAFLVLKKPVTNKYIGLRQPVSQQMPEYLILAADIGLNTGFTLLALLLFVCVIKQLGAVALAVHQITLQVFNFAYLPAMGFLITAAIIVPQLLENRQDSLLVPTVKRLGKMSLSVIFITSSLLFIFSAHVSCFFSPTDKLVAEQTATTLKLVCVGQLFSSIYMVMRGALTGCKDTRFIVYEGLVSGYCIFLPLAYLLAIQLGYGIFGGYIAFLIWCVTDCTVLVFRFYRKYDQCGFHREVK
ncbi:MATE family efflux transporter [Sporomusa acidovorans]|uniref:Probable multidrug resistance protein NorM n=1 Tax=Sporomusa acidovorans (strain ATCC 49682 / DSM 3132 / Mol) TaxID=1123286 RepID=A0ABZ3J043_SPOA4|nr:MATE family efflux transporter [Sporomusa acidovorans]OZC18288.1 multidrug resistance protein MdtK [Sporomusa acidovorans DSM 3132]SDF20944.1 putative efflux protein, MATE family [Sporomusa acidovorans]